MLDEVMTPPSVFDPDRMKILGEFTPVPNCHVALKKRGDKNNIGATQKTK